MDDAASRYESDRVLIVWGHQPGDQVASELPLRRCAHHVCGVTFQPTERKHIYCSKRCKRRATENRRRARQVTEGAPDSLCGECGVEIIWDPRHGDRCDNCYAEVTDG